MILLRPWSFHHTLSSYPSTSPLDSVTHPHGPSPYPDSSRDPLLLSSHRDRDRDCAVLPYHDHAHSVASQWCVHLASLSLSSSKPTRGRLEHPTQYCIACTALHGLELYAPHPCAVGCSNPCHITCPYEQPLTDPHSGPGAPRCLYCMVEVVLAARGWVWVGTWS